MHFPCSLPPSTQIDGDADKLKRHVFIQFGVKGVHFESKLEKYRDNEDCHGWLGVRQVTVVSSSFQDQEVPGRGEQLWQGSD